MGGTLINLSALVSVHHSNRLGIIRNPLVESDRRDFDPVHEVGLHCTPAPSLGGAIPCPNPFGGRSYSGASTRQLREPLQRSGCRKIKSPSRRCSATRLCPEPCLRHRYGD